MDGREFGQVLIEKYLRERRNRFYRADDGEFVILVGSTTAPFQMFMRARGTAPTVVKIRARWSMRFPRAERNRLLELVNKWNDHNQWLTASIRDTHDGTDLRVVGNSRIAVDENVDFSTFRWFVDLSVASAAKLFEEVAAEMKLPSPSEFEKWFEQDGPGK